MYARHVAEIFTYNTLMKQLLHFIFKIRKKARLTNVSNLPKAQD